jgi:hypothetical protein
MSTTVSRNIVRLAVNIRNPLAEVQDEFTAQQPVIWKGTDMAFQIAYFVGTDLLTITNLATVELTIKDAADIQGVTMFYQTLGQTVMNPGLVLDDWNDGSQQHVEFSGTANELDFFLDPALRGRPIALIFTAETVDTPAHRLTLGIINALLASSGRWGGIPYAPPLASSLITAGAVYTSGGTYTVIVEPGKLYSYEQGLNDTSLVNGTSTLTTPGTFVAQGTTVVLHGVPNAVVTASVYLAVYLTQDQSDARYGGGGGGGGGGTATASRGLLAFNNTAELRAYVGHADGTEYHTLGDASRGDGYARQYYFDGSSTATDNGASVVQPTDVATGSPGRYLQLAF